MTGKRTRGPTRGEARRARTISISLADRGQTTQDFAVGIGVFLLAIAFVFSFLPSVVTPYDSSVGGAETAQADRIADLIVHNVSTETPNEIDRSAFDGRYTNENLTAELGLRASDSDNVVFDRVNVSVETFEGSPLIHPNCQVGMYTMTSLQRVPHVSLRSIPPAVNAIQPVGSS